MAVPLWWTTTWRCQCSSCSSTQSRSLQPSTLWASSGRYVKRLRNHLQQRKRRVCLPPSFSSCRSSARRRRGRSAGSCWSWSSRGGGRSLVTPTSSSLSSPQCDPFRSKLLVFQKYFEEIGQSASIDESRLLLYSWPGEGCPHFSTEATRCPSQLYVCSKAQRHGLDASLHIPCIILAVSAELRHRRDRCPWV